MHNLKPDNSFILLAQIKWHRRDSSWQCV